MLTDLLLYRVRKYAPDQGGIFLGYDMPGMSYRNRERILVDAQKVAEADPENFVLVQDTHSMTLGVDLEAPKPSLATLAANIESDMALSPQLKGDATVSSRELIAAVVAKGDTPGGYGNHYWATDARDVLHLAACGADWTKFRGVVSERWREWHGTFAEDTYDDKLEVALSCRCGEFGGEDWDGNTIRFGLAMPSIAKLIVTLSAGQLEMLFND